MNNAVLILAPIVGIVAIDACAVAYGVHVGMKNPFIAAAIVNVGLLVFTLLTGIVWMLTRS